MKLINVICLTVLTLFVCADLSAQREKGKRKGRPDGQQRGNIMQMLKRLDTNGDKTLTADEIPDRLAKRMAQLDLDGNGAIDQREIQQLVDQMKRMNRQDNGAGKGKRRRGRDGKPNTDRPGDRPGDGKAKRKRGGPGSDSADGQQRGDSKRDGKGKRKGKADGNRKRDGKRKRDGANRRDTPNSASPQKMVADMMRRFDKNDDQLISKDEAPERMQENWDRIDQNGDGNLDPSELNTIAKMLQRRGKDGKAKGKQKRQREQDAKPRGGVKPKRPGSDG